MGDLAQEVLEGGGLGLAGAAALIPPRRGKKVSPATIRSWLVRGVSVDGKTIRLEGMRLVKAWRTTRPALERFLRLCGGGIPACPLRPDGEEVSR